MQAGEPTRTGTIDADAQCHGSGSALAPFRLRSFRFLWPSDQAASWAFEMEILILGWYVLVETGSVLLLTLFGALQWAGTLFSPLFGVAGDRIGHRRLLCLMRAFYLGQALCLLLLVLTERLNAGYVFVVATAMNLVRPSDMVMRFALIGETMPPAYLMSAMSIERTTSDSARVFGALTGAGMIAAFGMAVAYLGIVAVYLLALALTLGIAKPANARAAAASKPSSHRHDLVAAFRYVRSSPLLLAAMWLAFLVNLTAYPLTLGLLPYVARDVYGADQTGLGYLAASFACGGLVGSILLTRIGSAIRSGRWMVLSAAGWYALLALFALSGSIGWGVVWLLGAGCAQSFCLVPMSTVLLQHSEERYRGRVMGIRQFTIYGLPLGLLVAGPLIEHFGFAAMALSYCVAGATITLVIAWYWRCELWRPDAAANRS